MACGWCRFGFGLVSGFSRMPTKCYNYLTPTGIILVFITVHNSIVMYTSIVIISLSIRIDNYFGLDDYFGFGFFY